MTYAKEAQMARNRFEQVDEKQDDAITLALHKVENNVFGTVTIPAALSEGRLSADMTTDKMPLKDAFRGAIRVGNEMKAAVVVIDPASLWQSEWGDLYRAS
jgi:hypothetical protein